MRKSLSLSILKDRLRPLDQQDACLGDAGFSLVFISRLTFCHALWHFLFYKGLIKFMLFDPHIALYF